MTNKLLLLNILVAFIRKQCAEHVIPLEQLVAQVNRLYLSVTNIEVIDAINNIVSSGFIPEINRFDSENKVLYLNVSSTLVISDHAN